MPQVLRKLTSSTLAVSSRAGGLEGHMIPAGSFIKIDDSVALDTAGLVDVTWAEKKVIMFAKDLHSKSMLIRLQIMGESERYVVGP